LDNFIVPSFHATILSQSTGIIMIGGGTIELVEGPAKSKALSKFSLKTSMFKR